MLSRSERQQRILRKLRGRGRVVVAALSDELEVSEVTIRKDLRDLERQGLLYRTHGGAEPRVPLARGGDRGAEARVHDDEKRRIGEAAASLIRPGDSVILASGTTTAWVARCLDPPGELTVVTNALDVVMELSHLDAVELVMLGGVIRGDSMAVVCPQAEEMLGHYACDTLVLGAEALDVEHGLTTSDEGEARLARAMMGAARSTVVVADASKFGRRRFRRVCGLEEVDRIVTDRRLDDEVAEALEARGVSVERV